MNSHCKTINSRPCLMNSHLQTMNCRPQCVNSQQFTVSLPVITVRGPVITVRGPVITVRGPVITVRGPAIIFASPFASELLPLMGGLRQAVAMARTFRPRLPPLLCRPPQRCHGGALRPPACLGARACLQRLRHNRSGRWGWGALSAENLFPSLLAAPLFRLYLASPPWRCRSAMARPQFEKANSNRDFVICEFPF
jgi:hypothetical protein